MTQGFLEKYNSNLISGWARSASGDPILQVRIDGEIIGEVAPNISRQDFKGEKIGFVLDVSKMKLPKVACKVEVVFKDTGTHIDNSPVVTVLADEAAKGNVLIGKDNWLFLSNDTNRVIDQIQGKFLVSGSFDDEWEAFGLRLAEVESSGIEIHFLVVPNKECILEQYLPNDIVVSPGRPLSRVYRGLAKSWNGFYTRCFYPLETLRRAANKGSYPKGDTHWTSYGAWIAFKTLYRDTYPDVIAEISEEIDEIPRMKYENSDLLSKLGGVCVELKASCSLKWPRKTYDNRVMNTDSEAEWISTKFSEPKRVLLVHDSFGLYLVPYLARAFGYLYTCWSPNLSNDLIKRIKPDMILIQRVERFLVQPSKVI